jgi:predicted nucleotidyltransferase
LALNIKFEKNQVEDSGKNPKLEKLISKIKNFISNKFSEYEEIESIVLFGSLASGKFSEESDIDICVLFKQNTPKMLQNTIFNYFLSLGKDLNLSIQCVFFFPEDINNWDTIFIENILAEGQLLYGNSNYYEILIKTLEFKPYQIITLNLRALNNSAKMRLKRILYGYKTTKKYSEKLYKYKKEGIVKKLHGMKLGRGSFIIPEKGLLVVVNKLKEFDIKFSNFRVWMQEI